ALAIGTPIVTHTRTVRVVVHATPTVTAHPSTRPVSTPAPKPKPKAKPKPTPAPTPAPAPPAPTPTPTPAPEPTPAPAPQQATPAPTPEPAVTDESTKPGWGNGDKNHEHTGPPGQNKKQ